MGCSELQYQFTLLLCVCDNAIRLHGICVTMQGTYAGYDQSYSAYGSSAQGSVPAAVADAAQSLPAESQQKLANIVAKVRA